MRHRRPLALLLCLLLALPLGGCAAQSTYQRYSVNFFDTFDTLITIIAYAPDEQTFLTISNEAHARFQALHRLFDAYNAYDGLNNLYTLNERAAQAPVPVPRELMDLLLFCQEKQPLTQGSVNVALGAVLDIWHRYREAGLADISAAELPPLADLQAAAAHTAMANVALDLAQSTVFYQDAGLKLDLGAVAKGYAAELVAQHLLASPLSSFILSAGGNVRVGLPPRDGQRMAWGVGIQDPNGNVFSTPDSDIVETFFVSGLSLVTSGVYQRYYLVNGVRYHHLIDPATLMPGQHYLSVTVLAQDSGLADLLSTAAFLLPYEQSRALIESMDGVDALWIFPDNSVQMTDGARRYAKSAGATSLIEK
ncbi:MAG: FAD:protein FMN transferase [Oscillospiraceae bacterium]|jgi:thiamine biosynthesis lipoprotein|nr:FAD:protein FMN transferase [Oscillospiraceae bacterium]